MAEIPDAALEKVVKAFRQKGVTVTLPKLIEVDSEKCFSCGAWLRSVLWKPLLWLTISL